MSQIGAFLIGMGVCFCLLWGLAAITNETAKNACSDLTGKSCELRYVPVE